ncbi:helix-turn-helix domain-containing protein [Curtobacterium sp. MCSS17_006]|uniref:helix-turn-helix domain-containing protein n=1 Tax=Curtobacterium sp. MCSS17_006 TaxID=2175642 RepID=UPI0011B7897A|nr:helix-turn-helix transcriptional regulator [Curtobacterium sp. MCSS17_006]
MRNDKKQVQTSALNRSMAAVIRGEYNALDLSQAELVQATGISLATVQRLLKGEQKFSFDQVEAFAKALGLEVDELSRRAVEWRSTRMSEAAPDNVTQLQPRKRVEDMTVEEIEQLKHAATVDPEMDEPEQFD